MRKKRGRTVEKLGGEGGDGSDDGLLEVGGILGVRKPDQALLDSIRRW